MNDTEVNHEAIGHHIESFYVLGEERDGKNRWVGADLIANIPPLGRYFLNVVTKQHFANEHVGQMLEDVESPEDLFDDDYMQLERRPPFVLNDEVITEEILERKFQNRVVEADLAASLWIED